MYKNAIVGQSGGPTAVINASLYGVIKQCVSEPNIEKIYGMKNGIEGMLKEAIFDLEDVYTHEDFAELPHTPSSFLGSCRFKLPDDFNETYEKIFNIFKKYEIGYFFYIGGNDSMDTVSKLSEYAKMIGFEIYIMGVPKTIDNDLVLTDHTPGYGSAAKYIAQTIRQLVLDSGVYNKRQITVVECMGRHTGWLTASAMLAIQEKHRCEMLFYLPEIPFSPDKMIKDINDRFEKSNNIIVCVSEGIKFSDGTYVCEKGLSLKVDDFGHKALSGCSKILGDYIAEYIPAKIRTIEFSSLQRCCSTMASETDISEATGAGEFAVSGACNGETGKMVAYNRIQGNPYRIQMSFVDVNEVCNKEKYFPVEWILNGNTIKDDFIDYAKPLITGEPVLKYRDGLQVFLDWSK